MHPTERVHLLYILIVWTCFTVGCAFAASHGRVCLRRPPMAASVSAVPPFVPPSAVAWGGGSGFSGAVRFSPARPLLPLRVLSSGGACAFCGVSVGAVSLSVPSYFRERPTAPSLSLNGPSGLFPIAVGRGSLAYPPACLIRHRSQYSRGVHPAGRVNPRIVKRGSKLHP